MLVNKKYGKNFTTIFNKMCEKYGEEFEFINGCHETQLNGTTFIDNFTADNKKNAADTTIDPNSSVGGKDIQVLLKEKDKADNKMLCMNKIYYEINKKYGFATANEWYSLEFGPYLYMHDAPSASFMHYCYAYDLSRLAKEGLFFIENYNYEPPKHL